MKYYDQNKIYLVYFCIDALFDLFLSIFQSFHSVPEKVHKQYK